MEYFEIEGGQPLSGTIAIDGSKNAALPIMAACLLSEHPVHLKRLARLEDIRHMARVLEHLGATVALNQDEATITAGEIRTFDTPYDLMRRMRASTYVMGPLLARFGRATVALPGGCAIGARPINYHLKGFEQMGAKIEHSHGNVLLSAPKGLKGAHLSLNFPSVGATANLMMAATLARGVSVIDNAAQEPHIRALGEFLRTLGAVISGEGTHRIEVEGVDKLNGGTFTNLPDQIVAGTWLGASLITGCPLTLSPVVHEDLHCITGRFEEMGVVFEEGPDSLRVVPQGPLKPLEIDTMPHPGFPTDMQPVAAAVLCLARGVSTINETVFESRYLYTPELERMGAKLTVNGKRLIIQGVDKLEGAEVFAPDLRAGAALVMAALAAEGVSKVYGLEHIDRGYEHIEDRLSAVGAKIKRVRVLEA